VALTLSRTTLAQDGTALESEGLEPAGRVVYCCLSPPFLNLPSTPVKGEAGSSGGGGRNSVAPACLGTPSTLGGGEALRRGVVWHADPDDHPAAPSAWGKGAGSMAGKADPSLPRERERASSSHHGV
jgi:hypothetical protein